MTYAMTDLGSAFAVSKPKTQIAYIIPWGSFTELYGTLPQTLVSLLRLLSEFAVLVLSLSWLEGSGCGR